MLRAVAVSLCVAICCVRGGWEVGDRVQVLNTCNEDAWQLGTIIKSTPRRVTIGGDTFNTEECEVRLDNGKIIQQTGGMLQRENADEERRQRARRDRLLTGPFENGDKLDVVGRGLQFSGREGTFDCYHTHNGEQMASVDFSESSAILEFDSLEKLGGRGAMANPGNRSYQEHRQIVSQLQQMERNRLMMAEFAEFEAEQQMTRGGRASSSHANQEKQGEEDEEEEDEEEEEEEDTGEGLDLSDLLILRAILESAAARRQ